MTQLLGKTAVITGASSGIGASVAMELAKEGANIVLAARRIDKLAEIENKIKQLNNVKVISVQTDVAKKQDVKNLIKKAVETFQHVDILVNNAGQMLSSPIVNGHVEDWEKMIDVNIKGVLYGINEVLPAMLERSSGHIINIGSVSGFEVTKKSTVYSATKFAVRAISAGLEKELARTGVRVTNISPGMVDTNLVKDGSRKIDRKMLEPSDIGKAVIYAVTQPDYVNVNEITVRPV